MDTIESYLAEVVVELLLTTEEVLIVLPVLLQVGNASLPDHLVEVLAPEKLKTERAELAVPIAPHDLQPQVQALHSALEPRRGVVQVALR